MIPVALRGWRGAALMVVLTAAVITFAPAPGDPAPSGAPPETWFLPEVAGNAPARAAEALGKANLWGSVAAVASGPPLNEPDWRFVGIVRTGTERFVLIQVQGKPEQRLTVNDTLPGGSQILTIEDDSLCILISGTRRKLAIRNTGPQIL